MAVGGFESMSNGLFFLPSFSRISAQSGFCLAVPYYAPQQRAGSGYGHTQLLDGILKDGLWDAFDDHHMVLQM